jgi:hypothetical protein
MRLCLLFLYIIDVRLRILQLLFYAVVELIDAENGIIWLYLAVAM